MRKEEIIDLIRHAFGATPYPGDAFLQGSFDGSEPGDEVAPFVGKSDWSIVESTLLDQRYSALSFFSGAAFRFFLPAYLIADLREELFTADPLFHLWHGLATVSAEVPVGPQTFRRETGGQRLLNPNRYGAMTWNDYAHYRLSVFTREEAKAIVAYMVYKSEHGVTEAERSTIDTALNDFWFDRAANAPTFEDLRAHLNEEERFIAAIQRQQSDPK